MIRRNAFPLCFFLLLASLSSFQTLHAQYVRREFFSDEHQRRMRYALDDWISYTTTRSFSDMTVGTNYIYFATRDGGILRYHFYEDYWDYPFTTSNGLPSNRVEQVVYDPRTAFLWAVTPNDVAIFNPASEEWIRRSENPDWIYQFPDSTIINPNTPGKERFFGREALALLPTYFANGDYSIINDWILMDRNFQEFPIVGYLIDRYDRIWFPVDGFGIGQGSTFSQRIDFYALGMPDIFPRAIAYQKDDLWLGGIGQERRNPENRPGIALWPYDETGWEYYQARWISRLPSDNVEAILVDGDSVWFGTDYGVSLYDRGRDRWQNFFEGKGLISNEVHDLAIMNDYLYVATVFGMSRISLLTGSVEKIKDTRLINLPFHRLSVQNDTLWAGTFRGIFRLIGSTGKWEFVPSQAAIQDFDVTAVDAFEHEVWFAASGGIMWLDTRTDTWESFPQVAYDVAGPYEDIKATAKAVWVATPEGLLKYNRELKYWKLFTTQDGLLNDHCRRLLLDGDYIWIVTDGGVTEFFWNNPNRSD